MLLSEAVSAVLHDLTKAQDYANQYASELSKKYQKQRENNEANNLSNYPVPLGRLNKLKLDLKFAIEELKETQTIDIDETHRQTELLAEDFIEKYAIKTFTRFLEQKMDIKDDSSTTENEQEVDPSLDPSESGSKEEKSQRKRAIREQWRKICEQSQSTPFKQYLTEKVSRELNNYINKSYHQERKSLHVTRDRVCEIFANAITKSIVTHEDIKDVIEETESLYDKRKGTYQFSFQKLYTDLTNKILTQDQVKQMISYINETETEVQVELDQLSKYDKDLISTLEIEAEIDNYRWMITKTDQTLEKVQE